MIELNKDTYLPLEAAVSELNRALVESAEKVKIHP